MVEGLLNTEKNIQGQNNGRKSPFMMRSSSKSQEIKKSRARAQQNFMRIQKWSQSKRLFVKVGSDG
jgi:hypothetical protein